MKRRNSSAKVRSREGGYALLLVIFLTALVLIGSMSASLRILTEGRRQKEQEMIWRGKQYTRGIKLYYRKYGRFPTSVDNLTKPQMGNIRFMRQAYTDPMNKQDGSWRMIYVGPAGQLIGSLKPPTSLQMPTPGGQPGAPITTSSGFGSPLSSGTTGSPLTATPGAAGAGPVTTGSPAGAQGTDSSGTSTTPQPIPSGDTPTIVGGNIIGIGSKIDQSSVIVYETATNYRLFEFVWNPSKDMGVISVGSTGPGGQSATPGQGATGTGTGTQSNPLAPPQQPPTAAPPNPQQPPQQQ